MYKEAIERYTKEFLVKPIKFIIENPVRTVTLGLVRKRPVRRIHPGVYSSKR